jgi:hydroxycarboxylate dehydrogenase B
MQADRLVRWVTALLEAYGTPAPGAERVAAALVDADRCGHRSHGVRQLPYYTDQIQRGELFPAAEPLVIGQSAGLIRVEGRRGFGQLVGEHATETAMSAAAEHSVAAVAVRDANHLGRLGAYTERIGAAGLVGILLANNQGADQQVAPFGSAERRLTNNPISIGVPGPAVLDIALSVAAEGRVYRAHERGEAVPSGWILDSEGAPSTDPESYMSGGSLLPVGGAEGGHKGYGLIVLVELLVGLLTLGGMCGPG